MKYVSALTFPALHLLPIFYRKDDQTHPRGGIVSFKNATVKWNCPQYLNAFDQDLWLTLHGIAHKRIPDESFKYNCGEIFDHHIDSLQHKIGGKIYITDDIYRS